MRMNGSYYGTLVPEVGPYQFTVSRFPVTPESVAPNLTGSDTVTAEAIDYLSDLDQFTVTAGAGQGVVADVTPTALRLEALQMGSLDTLRTGSAGSTGVVTVPAGGQFRLVVFEQRRYLGRRPQYRELWLHRTLHTETPHDQPCP